ncbi:MAG: hypothetical protein ACP5IA_12390, partial [Sediminispirochaetaceae bacterium]
MEKNQLSALPQIETLLQDPQVDSYIECLSRPVVAAIARATIENIR